MKAKRSVAPSETVRNKSNKVTDLDGQLDEIAHAAEETRTLVNAANTIGASTRLEASGRDRVLTLLGFAEEACGTVVEMVAALRERMR